ncbi:MAG TPA: hypothetical protein VG742_02465 [Dongiaceae bacterium]|nr:hypothetical protein [Dongiaceae bacterium]
MKSVIAVICLLLAPLAAGSAAAQDGNLTIATPGGEMILTAEQLQALPQRELTEQPTNFPKPGRFRGPLLADVLTVARAAGKDVKLTALDDYQVTITADEMAQHNPILALELDGATLIGHDFGPYFVMWPFREKPEIDNEAFQAKAIWQVIKIEVQ